MKYSRKSNEADARERLRAFWAGSSLGRPALHVLVANPDWELPPWPGLNLDRKALDLVPEYHAWLRRCENDRWEHLAEAMPYHHVEWGSHLALLPVLAGGDYEYHESAWIHPLDNLWERALPQFDPAHPVIQALDQCYDATRAAVDGQALITPPLPLDALTALSLLRGCDELCTDLLDHPEQVMAWSRALTTIYMEVYERYYKRLGYGESVCFFGPLAEGRSEGVQCDFAVNLSPAMFEEFVLPDLQRVTDYMDFSLYHTDGTCQLRFLDLLCQCPKLTGIQWNPETIAPRPPAWIEAFREIRRRGLVLMMGCTVDEAVVLTRELGPDGLFLLLPVFSSRDEAQEAINLITASVR